MFVGHTETQYHISELSDTATVLLIDFPTAPRVSTHGLYEHDLMYEKLREKMNEKRRKAKPFAMKFEVIHTFGHWNKEAGHSNQHFNWPWDVKISYNHQCILIADNSNCRIQVFDLLSKVYKKTISVMSPFYLCIEENYDSRGNDALIYVTGSCIIHKHDLRQLLETGNTNQTIWRSELLRVPRGIAIHPVLKQLFVSEVTARIILILSLDTGKLISQFSVENQPWGLAFTDDNDLIVSETSPQHRIEIFRKLGKEWTSVHTFGREGHAHGELSHCYSVIYDRAAHHIIVSEYNNDRIQVFTKDGQFLNAFTGFQTQFLKWPNGLCLNELTGELYCCDSQNNRVISFK
ncbi:hypothetical protein C9374_004434 [Naegleria lovaniensis]|uniref:Uncharacterized protein n=1 Tax=Naegleria lovaniensis TaxID=51637 RepID=A0AA88GRB6_NAELO|nr:uncharacterized protein C9374_004434 [Naegleria lovaniensis]KAG2383097.1 hypothetical protein C9374_004434 [Naegleria lovaniensis]